MKSVQFIVARDDLQQGKFIEAALPALANTVRASRAAVRPTAVPAGITVPLNTK